MEKIAGEKAFDKLIDIIKTDVVSKVDKVSDIVLGENRGWLCHSDLNGEYTPITLLGGNRIVMYKNTDYVLSYRPSEGDWISTWGTGSSRPSSSVSHKDLIVDHYETITLDEADKKFGDTIGDIVTDQDYVPTYKKSIDGKIEALSKKINDGVIVHRAISVGAKAGDVYYFASGQIKFKASFADIEGFDTFLDTNFKGHHKNIGASYYATAWKETNIPVLVKILPHGETFSSDWFEIRQMRTNEMPKFSCHTRSPFFDIVKGKVICTKPISTEDADFAVNYGYTESGKKLYEYTNRIERVGYSRPKKNYYTGAKIRMSIFKKFRIKRGGTIVRCGLHRVYGKHRGYKSILYREVHAKRYWGS